MTTMKRQTSDGAQSHVHNSVTPSNLRTVDGKGSAPKPSSGTGNSQSERRGKQGNG